MHTCSLFILCCFSLLCCAPCWELLLQSRFSNLEAVAPRRQHQNADMFHKKLISQLMTPSTSKSVQPVMKKNAQLPTKLNTKPPMQTSAPPHMRQSARTPIKLSTSRNARHLMKKSVQHPMRPPMRNNAPPHMCSSVKLLNHHTMATVNQNVPKFQKRGAPK